MNSFKYGMVVYGKNFCGRKALLKQIGDHIRNLRYADKIIKLNLNFLQNRLNQTFYESTFKYATIWLELKEKTSSRLGQWK